MKYLYLIVFIIFTGCNSSSNTFFDDNITSDITDPLFYQQWSIEYNSTFYSQNDIDQDAHIHCQNSLNNFSGKGVRIAIIDDGFDINHPEIRNNIIATIAIDDNGNISNDVSHSTSSSYHGTAVSGIIAAEHNTIGIRGIASNAQLILIKMPQNFTDSIEIELFKQAVKYGADIISCSWGTNDVSDTVKDYIEDISSTARDGKGVIIVFASGNDDTLMKNDESAIPTVLGVGATSRDNLRTSYSNYGKDLDLVAPGGYDVGIATIDPLGSYGISNDDYNRYDEYNNGKPVSFIGTSASAPIVSGTLALALEKKSTLTRSEIFELLKYSTDTIGENTPYIDDMISSKSQTPTITGLLGSSGNSNIKIKLISQSSSTVYGPYALSYIDGNNHFTSNVTDTLPEGNYTIKIVDTDDTFVYATLENFIIDTNGETKTNSSIRKSDFYGYGKINVDKLLSNF